MNFPSLSQSNIHKSSLKAFISRVAGCFDRTLMDAFSDQRVRFYEIFLKDRNMGDTTGNINYTLNVLKDVIKDYKFGFDIEPYDDYNEIKDNNKMIKTFFNPLDFEEYIQCRQTRRYKINANFMEQLMTFYETHYGATFIRRYGGYVHNMNKLYVLTLEQIIREGIWFFANLSNATRCDEVIIENFLELKNSTINFYEVAKQRFNIKNKIDEDEKLHEESNQECIICLDKKFIRILCNTCNECKLCYVCAQKIKDKCPCCRTNNFKKIQRSIYDAINLFNR
jgi:hypothetical protein